MIDTIHIELQQQQITNLTKNSDTIDSGTGEIMYSIGYIDNVKVKQHSRGIKIECSLPKILKGSNLYQLNFLEIADAIRLIESKIGISINEGIIRRLDVYVNIETIFKPASYFRSLGSSRYLTRSLVGKTSLYYKNNFRENNFYDKITEMNARSESIPIDYQNKNILRFESRLKNTFLRKFSKKKYNSNLKISMLFDPEFLIFLVDFLMLEYQNIYKEKKLNIDFKKIDSKKSLIERLACKGIEAFGGVNEVLEMIDASRIFNEKVHKEYFSRRKSEIKEVAKLDDFTFKDKKIDELDDKFNVAKNMMLVELQNDIKSKK